MVLRNSAQRFFFYPSSRSIQPSIHRKQTARPAIAAIVGRPVNCALAAAEIAEAPGVFKVPCTGAEVVVFMGLISDDGLGSGGSGARMQTVLAHASHDGGVSIHSKPARQVGHAGVSALQPSRQRRRTLLEAEFSRAWVLLLALIFYCCRRT